MLQVLLLTHGLLSPRGTQLGEKCLRLPGRCFLSPPPALTARVAVDRDEELLPALKTCINGVLKVFVCRGSYFGMCSLPVASLAAVE